MGADLEHVGLSLEAADVLAAELLGDGRTELGGLQIDHARRVAAGVARTGDEQMIAAALLHDVLEKTSATATELLRRTEDPTVVGLVEILSREVDEPERVYLARCAGDPAALVIKRADLEDKLTATDARVSVATRMRLQRQARDRLVLLDLMARWHHDA